MLVSFGFVNISIIAMIAFPFTCVIFITQLACLNYRLLLLLLKKFEFWFQMASIIIITATGSMSIHTTSNSMDWLNQITPFIVYAAASLMFLMACLFDANLVATNRFRWVTFLEGTLLFIWPILTDYTTLYPIFNGEPFTEVRYVYFVHHGTSKTCFVYSKYHVYLSKHLHFTCTFIHIFWFQVCVIYCSDTRRLALSTSSTLLLLCLKNLWYRYHYPACLLQLN